METLPNKICDNHKVCKIRNLLFNGSTKSSVDPKLVIKKEGPKRDKESKIPTADKN